MLRDPLPLLLDAYARYGPVFTLRLLTSNVIVLLGPEANHHVLVSNAANFSWREGSLGNLIPLLGDGLLTIDGDFHRRSRRIMLPVFHHEHIGAALETMDAEIEAAMAPWRVGDTRRPLRLDSRAGPADRDAIAVRARSGRPGGAVDRRRPAVQRGAAASTPTTCPSSGCAAPGRHGGGCSGPGVTSMG